MLRSALLAALIASSAGVRAAPCAFDREFALGGLARTGIPGAIVFGSDLVRDDAGRYLVAAYGREPPSSLSFVAVGRYGADGELDTTYGTAGFARWFSGDEFAPVAANRLAVDALGRVYVLLTEFSVPRRNLLLRFAASGELDTSFGSDGVARPVCPGVATDEDFPHLLLDALGRPLVSSRAGGVSFVVRLREDGALDPVFSGDGCAQFPSLDSPQLGLLPRPPGYELVGQDAQGVWTLRVDATGTPDPGYGNAGVARASAPFPARDAALQGSRVVLIGDLGSAVVGFARLTESGALDATFGDAGVRLVDFTTKDDPNPNQQARRIVSATDGTLAAIGTYAGFSGIGRTYVAVVAADGGDLPECDAPNSYVLATEEDGGSTAGGVLFDGDRLLVTGSISPFSSLFGDLAVLALTPNAAFRAGFE